MEWGAGAARVKPNPENMCATRIDSVAAHHFFLGSTRDGTPAWRIDCKDGYDGALGEYAEICRIRPMRRLIALIIMFVVPFRFAWAAAAGLHGYLAMDTGGTHVVHDHDHHDANHAGHGLAAFGSTDGEQPSDDGHHDSHCHHVSSFILHQPGPLPRLELTSGPLRHAPDTFLSRIPPLLDRPPLTRA